MFTGWHKSQPLHGDRPQLPIIPAQVAKPCRRRTSYTGRHRHGFTLRDQVRRPAGTAKLRCLPQGSRRSEGAISYLTYLGCFWRSCSIRHGISNSLLLTECTLSSQAVLCNQSQYPSSSRTVPGKPPPKQEARKVTHLSKLQGLVRLSPRSHKTSSSKTEAKATSIVFAPRARVVVEENLERIRELPASRRCTDLSV